MRLLQILQLASLLNFGGAAVAVASYGWKFGIDDDITVNVLFAALTGAALFCLNRFNVLGDRGQELERPQARVDGSDVDRKMTTFFLALPIALSTLAAAAISLMSTPSTTAFGWMIVVMGGNLGHSLEAALRLSADNRGNGRK